VAPWTLSDFAPGSLTWTEPSSIEYDYGIFRTDGTPKPIAASLRAFFGSGSIDTSFDNGFESAVSALPAEWSVFPASGAQFARDTAVAHTGHASARIARSGNDLSGAPSFYTTPIVNIVPGHAYAATVWARGQSASGENRVTLAWFNASGAYLGQSVSELLPPGTTTWRRLVVRGVAPHDAAAVNIFLESAYNRGEVWFDDATFQ
jgi:hypothetical protein